MENTREMVLQYRNHPSIILWGVRINESQDDDKFYKRTNKTAHDLDPSRATSGVRYLEKSHLLEDVYAFNDFSYDGTGDGAKKKSSVTPDMSKALLISENNGHMFPTKPFDNSDRRPFTAKMDGVTVIDNTKGQIIDFEKELAKYRMQQQRQENMPAASDGVCLTIPPIRTSARATGYATMALWMHSEIRNRRHGSFPPSLMMGLSSR